ncbi:MAG: calcium-binding protein [Xenococcaceae cyanobacterium MO_188.B29]|nr:calcium-binding protein [Xenococcaceae cyanobacterium MO_188.B29]
MSEVEQDHVREERIDMEAVVDAYNEEERAMGWYYYLEDRINFPFKAKWINRNKPEGRDVMVIEMSPEDKCSSDMFVEVIYREGDFEDVFSARLSEIEPINIDSATEEAIGDWHYWIAREYQF